MTKPSPRITSFPLSDHDLVGDGSWLSNLTKAASAPAGYSKQGSLIGRVQPLIDYDSVSQLKDHNVHHSAALEAKVAAAVGLGHRSDNIPDILNELCVVSWADTLEAVVADYFEYANGFLEVVRDVDSNEIVGLHHLPARDVRIYLEENRNIFHYEIADKGDFAVTQLMNGLRFARFGEREDYITRRNVPEEAAETVSEVIHFPMNRGRRSPHYGFPDWLAATPPMELDHCVTQYQFDFFFNGGIPEAIYSIIGKTIDPDDWEKIKTEFAKHTGIGNKRKLLMLNWGDPEIRAQLDKLTLDGQTTGDNQPMVDALALKILSAHRTPPILAGVTQPGKMGANNEITNAIMLFQLLVIGPAQKTISQILACTLGDDELGVAGLTEEDFLGVGTGDPELDPTRPIGADGTPPTRPVDFKGNGFRTTLDEINLGEMDTVGRMRMSLSEAQSRGRDLSQGTAERGSDIDAGRGDRS